MNPLAFGIIEIRDIERDDFVIERQQMARQVNAEESRAARQQKSCHLGRVSSLFGKVSHGTLSNEDMRRSIEEVRALCPAAVEDHFAQLLALPLGSFPRLMRIAEVA